MAKELQHIDLTGKTRRAPWPQQSGLPCSSTRKVHRSIARLFPSAEQLRIVTTNYDTHLAAAARQVFGAEPETYRAPTLPLGRDFSGIVYLHGSVEQEPRHLVATDSDFGHAYLTDAWAARFLQEMFRSFAVLFIGYSHNDIVMTYLARGLAPGSQPRFGFASDSTPPEWPGLGIKAICYPAVRNHAALGEAVGEWADLARMGLLDHERRIADLAADHPPADLPTRSYLERVVTDSATTPLFTRDATGIDWLEWARSLPGFRGLFQPASQLGPAAEELGRWFADTFAAASPDQALLTAYQFGGALHPAVASRVALALWRAPRADAAIIGRWAPVLLASASAADRTLSMLLSGSLARRQGQRPAPAGPPAGPAPGPDTAVRGRRRPNRRQHHPRARRRGLRPAPGMGGILPPPPGRTRCPGRRHSRPPPAHRAPDPWRRRNGIGPVGSRELRADRH
jgi:hypothetical protein